MLSICAGTTIVLTVPYGKTPRQMTLRRHRRHLHLRVLFPHLCHLHLRVLFPLRVLLPDRLQEQEVVQEDQEGDEEQGHQAVQDASGHEVQQEDGVEAHRPGRQPLRNVDSHNSALALRRKSIVCPMRSFALALARSRHPGIVQLNFGSLFAWQVWRAFFFFTERKSLIGPDAVVTALPRGSPADWGGALQSEGRTLRGAAHTRHAQLPRSWRMRVQYQKSDRQASAFVRL